MDLWVRLAAELEPDELARMMTKMVPNAAQIVVEQERLKVARAQTKRNLNKQPWA
jgi:hypothetical protein